MLDIEIDQQNVISPILALNYDSQQSMTLQWNFHGVKNTKSQISNLFVFSNLEQAKSQRIIQQFYDQSWLGDLIGVLNLSKAKTFKSIQWYERSGLDVKIQISQHNRECQNFINILQQLLPRMAKRRGLNIINFYNPRIKTEKSTNNVLFEREQIEEFFSSWITQNHCIGSLALNIITDKNIENQINIHKGVNLFSGYMKKENELCGILRKYINSIRLSKVNIIMKICSQEYHVGFSKNQGWINSDFNTLEKTFYNVPCLNFCQKMIVCLNDNKSSKFQSIDCTFELLLTFLDGTEYRTLKQFYLCVQDFRNYHKTINFAPTQIYQQIQLWKGEHVLVNLFNKEHFLFLKRIVSSQKPKKHKKQLFRW